MGKRRFWKSWLLLTNWKSNKYIYENFMWYFVVNNNEKFSRKEGQDIGKKKEREKGGNHIHW